MLRVRLRRVGTATVIALAVTGAAHAGAGLRSGGDLLYSTRVGYISSTEQWDPDSTLQDSSCRSEYSSYSHAVEYGYSYYQTVYGQTSLAQSSCGTRSKTGMSDVRVGLRGRLNVYENTGSWELETVIPINRGRSESRRLGCGQFGVAGSLHRKHEAAARLDVEYGASALLWESPLAHQARGYVGLQGGFLRNWSWAASAQGSAPVTDGAGDPGSLISDCGTEGKIARGVVELKFRPADPLSVGCGYTEALWGEDVSRARGLSCGFSYLWKD